MLALSDHDVTTLSGALQRAGHNPTNARRVLCQYWGANGAYQFSDFPIAKPARAWLAESFPSSHSKVVHRHVSTDGTIKLVIGFAQGGAVECVLMPSHRADRV